MDPIEPISPISPITPVWPVWPETYPHVQPPLPDAIRQRLPLKRPQPPAETPDVAPVEEFVPPAPVFPIAPPRDLRRVLLDAGVGGMGPLGPGFDLTEAEMAQELQWAYRHIANSLLGILPGQPALTTAIPAALAHDVRDEREMGLLLIAQPKLEAYLQTALAPGLLNRWRQQGEQLVTHLQTHPHSVIGDLHLVEPPTHRWHP